MMKETVLSGSVRRMFSGSLAVGLVVVAQAVVAQLQAGTG